MHPDSTRRDFLLASLGLIAAGCAGTSSTSTLPNVPWSPVLGPEIDPQGDDSWVRDTPSGRMPSGRAQSPATSPVAFDGVLPRSQWSSGNPITSRMDRLSGVNRITIHHDGMNPFYSSTANDAAARMDLIRRAHQGKGWGDIGYHFVVDPAGRVWEARSLAYQGAHVKYQNPGNIGVMCLGNFERQSPTNAQVQAMVNHVRTLQATYRVPVSRVYTHRELAATACPGRSLQAQVVGVRRGGNFG